MASTKNKMEQESKTATFEENMKKLEEIATELENGNLDLDTSVKKFEEGMKISKECNEILEKAEKKITMLIKNDDNELTEENFIQEEE